jgi:hypothetical protein
MAHLRKDFSSSRSASHLDRTTLPRKEEVKKFKEVHIKEKNVRFLAPLRDDMLAMVSSTETITKLHPNSDQRFNKRIDDHFKIYEGDGKWLLQHTTIPSKGYSPYRYVYYGVQGDKVLVGMKLAREQVLIVYDYNDKGYHKRGFNPEIYLPEDVEIVAKWLNGDKFLYRTDMDVFVYSFSRNESFSIRLSPIEFDNARMVSENGLFTIGKYKKIKQYNLARLTTGKTLIPRFEFDLPSLDKSRHFHTESAGLCFFVYGDSNLYIMDNTKTQDEEFLRNIEIVGEIIYSKSISFNRALFIVREDNENYTLILFEEGEVISEISFESDTEDFNFIGLSPEDEVVLLCDKNLIGFDINTRTTRAIAQLEDNFNIPIMTTTGRIYNYNEEEVYSIPS